MHGKSWHKKAASFPSVFKFVSPRLHASLCYLYFSLSAREMYRYTTPRCFICIFAVRTHTRAPHTVGFFIFDPLPVPVWLAGKPGRPLLCRMKKERAPKRHGERGKSRKRKSQSLTAVKRGSLARKTRETRQKKKREKKKHFIFFVFFV